MHWVLLVLGCGADSGLPDPPAPETLVPPPPSPEALLAREDAARRDQLAARRGHLKQVVEAASAAGRLEAVAHAWPEDEPASDHPRVVRFALDNRGYDADAGQWIFERETGYGKPCGSYIAHADWVVDAVPLAWEGGPRWRMDADEAAARTGELLGLNSVEVAVVAHDHLDEAPCDDVSESPVVRLHPIAWRFCRLALSMNGLSRECLPTWH